MTELLQAWRSKNCILDMYLTFYQMYSATESYRDFLEMVLDHFEKTKIAEYCEEESERMLRTGKVTLETQQNVLHMDCKSEPHLPNSIPSSVSSSAQSAEFTAQPPYWDNVTLTPVTTTETFTQLTNVTVTATGSDEFKIEQQCSSQPMLAGNTPVSGEVCSDAWTLSESFPLLRSELVTVTNGPPSPPPPSKSLRCSVCRKIFPTRGHLTRHSLVHTDARPFHCRYCPAAFKRAHHRTEHERTHTGERPYPCRYCSQRYTRASSRNDHELAHIKAANQQRQTIPPPVSIAPAQTVVHLRQSPQLQPVSGIKSENGQRDMDIKPTIEPTEPEKLEQPDASLS